MGGTPLPEGHPQAGLRAHPIPAQPPGIYVLGATVASAKAAAELSLPYVFSLFIGADLSTALEAVQAYRDHFQWSEGKRSEVIIALSVIAADTDEEAQAQIPPYKVVKVHLGSGKTVTVGTREQAEEYGRTSGDSYTVEEKDPFILAGSRDTVAAEIVGLHEASGVEEFIVTTNVPDFAKRLRSFELLAEAFPAKASGEGSALAKALAWEEQVAASASKAGRGD